MTDRLEDIRRQLIDAGRRFDARGWVLGTSGNFSVVSSAAPLRLAITASGASKGDLTAEHILEVDAEGNPLGSSRFRPSAETRLHLEIVNARGAGAVLHTHSIWSTLLSDRHAGNGGLAIEGFEMLKGLEGVSTHEHREWLPIVENDQNMGRLAGRILETLGARADAHAFLIRRHGMYTWGRTLPDAVRHVEIVEFLLEAVARGSLA